jgi:hypothetical protein
VHDVEEEPSGASGKSVGPLIKAGQLPGKASAKAAEK